MLLAHSPENNDEKAFKNSHSMGAGVPNVFIIKLSQFRQQNSVNFISRIQYTLGRFSNMFRFKMPAYVGPGAQ